MRATTNTIIFETQETLMQIPIKMAKLSSDLASPFKTCCTECHEKNVKGVTKRTENCSACNKVLLKADKSNFIPLEGDKYRVINEQELSLLKSTEKEIQVIGSILKKNIDPSLVKNNHWVLPYYPSKNKPAEKCKIISKKEGQTVVQPPKQIFAILKKAIEESKLALTIKFKPTSGREKVGVLTSHNGYLVALEYPYFDNINEITDTNFDLSNEVVPKPTVEILKEAIGDLKQVDPLSITDTYEKTLNEILDKPEVKDKKQIKANEEKQIESSVESAFTLFAKPKNRGKKQ